MCVSVCVYVPWGGVHIHGAHTHICMHMYTGRCVCLTCMAGSGGGVAHTHIYM